MDRDELIQGYLFNKLTDKQSAEFNMLLESDLDFKKEVAFQKELFQAMEEVENKKLKTELQELDKPNIKRLLFKWVAAASILFLVGIMYTTFKKESPATLFAVNFQVYPNVIHPVVRGEESISSTEKAFVFYENGDYIKFIQNIEKIKNTKIDYNFFIGNAYLATNQTKESILIFTDYIAQPDAKYKDKAKWYLALAYLKNSDVERAKKYLKQIVKSKSYNFKKAESLLKQL